MTARQAIGLFPDASMTSMNFVNLNTFVNLDSCHAQ